METGPTWRLGAVVGRRYRLDGEIGRGGFGAVFRATTLDTRSPVAVKLLTGAMRHDETSVARLRREAELAMRLTHPSTVRVLDHGDAGDGTPFVVFELLEGTTLEEHLRLAGPLSPGEALFVTQALLGSLDEAHRLGIVHRDIKPANVMLRAGADAGSIKLLDFGVAKIAGEAGGLTKEGLIVGTPAYMAPEQIAGGAVGPATDLYAVGLCLAEMITAAPVYRGAAMAICVEKLRSGRAELPEAVVRSAFGGVIERVTRPAAEARYASAQELSLSLAAVGVAPVSIGERSGALAPAEGLAPTERAPGQTGTRPRERGPRWVLGVAIGVAMAAVGLGVWANRRASTGTTDPPTRAERRSPSPQADRATPPRPTGPTPGTLPPTSHRQTAACAKPPPDLDRATKLIEIVGKDHGVVQADGVTIDGYKVAFARATRDGADFMTARVVDDRGLDEVGSMGVFGSRHPAALDAFADQFPADATVVVIDGFSAAARAEIKQRLCGER